jgi:O-antigen ligase
MRWASHAIMLVVFMISLPQLVTVKQIQQMMTILKYMMAFMVIISWMVPSLQTHYDSGDLYEGAMGNANSMGDIAFITAFLFMQNYITEKVPRARYIAGALAVIAMMTVWKSGARSAMVALICGIVLLCYYYRKSMRASVLVCILAGSVLMVSFPEVPEHIFNFAQKTDPNTKVTGAMRSRLPVWTAAYEGFKARPIVGWGFGADSNISRQWSVQLTSIGTVERDVVNDVLFMLEGGGILGLVSYLLSIWLVLKQCPNRSQRSILQNFRREQENDGADWAVHHAHVAMYLLPVCLLVLTQFDNTAFSAGNLISVTLWLCTGSAAVLRHEIGTQ